MLLGLDQSDICYHLVLLVQRNAQNILALWPQLLHRAHMRHLGARRLPLELSVSPDMNTS